MIREPVAGRRNGVTVLPAVAAPEPTADTDEAPPPVAVPDGPWMTTREAAAYTRFSVDSIKKMASHGRIPVHKQGRRNRYHKDELDRWLRTGQVSS